MAKKTTSTKNTKAAKAAKPAKPTKTAAKKGPKPVPAAAKPRHPRARVQAAHGSKAELAKSLASELGGEDTAALESRLAKASNQQLLRLSRVTSTVKAKYGDRDKLIAAIAGASKQSKDGDYAAKLATYSLPHLLDLATSATRRAR